MSRGCGHPSCRQEKESCWRHACGCRLRTVLHRTATSLGLPPPMSSSCICIAAHYAPALADEDDEQDPDRWCSHSAWGQECWQLVSQWVWNLRAVRWDISWSQLPCVSPSLLLPLRRRTSRPPPHPLPPPGMVHPPLPPASESWPLLWLRLSSPTRWDAPVPSRAAASPP